MEGKGTPGGRWKGRPRRIGAGGPLSLFCAGKQKKEGPPSSLPAEASARAATASAPVGPQPRNPLTAGRHLRDPDARRQAVAWDQDVPLQPHRRGPRDRQQRAQGGAHHAVLGEEDGGAQAAPEGGRLGLEHPALAILVAAPGVGLPPAPARSDGRRGGRRKTKRVEDNGRRRGKKETVREGMGIWNLESWGARAREKGGGSPVVHGQAVPPPDGRLRDAACGQSVHLARHALRLAPL